ncbi:CRISPR-associated protein Cas4 [Caldithrix abyssi]
MQTIHITGTLIWYYFICPREVWLMSRQVHSFQDNPFLEIGRFLQEESYTREKKSIRLENLELDLIQNKDGRTIIGEVKKSSKFIKSATMQLAFYLKQLEKYGIQSEGQLLFPKERKRITVQLTDSIRQELQAAEEAIHKIVEQQTPPPVVPVKWCRNCAYRDFCFI